MTAIVWYMLEWTVLGRHIRACGSAREAPGSPASR